MVWYGMVWYGRVLRGQMGAYDTDNGSAWLALRMWPKKLACYATAPKQPGHTLAAPRANANAMLSHKSDSA